jgi:uncharacterized protein with PQ loop repeat
MIIETIGWVSAIAFAICAAPQAYMSWKDGHAHGLAWAFLMLWYIGELFGLIYVIALLSYPLIFNYALNVILVTIILKYKTFPRKESHG